MPIALNVSLHVICNLFANHFFQGRGHFPEHGFGLLGLFSHCVDGLEGHSVSFHDYVSEDLTSLARGLWLLAVVGGWLDNRLWSSPTPSASVCLFCPHLKWNLECKWSTLFIVHHTNSLKVKFEKLSTESQCCPLPPSPIMAECLMAVQWIWCCGFFIIFLVFVFISQLILWMPWNLYQHCLWIFLVFKVQRVWDKWNWGHIQQFCPGWWW